MSCPGVAPSLASAIDWSRPWFSPWHQMGAEFEAPPPAGIPVHELLHRCRGAPVQFVAHTDLPPGAAYESHIFQTGCVPTRDNLHDFFNGLVWLRFPCTKKRLNQLQAAEIAAAGVGAVRGRVRDALTLFDENAALLQAPDPIWEALLARDWQRLFVGLRPLWAEVRLVLFGHALLEKLVLPYKSITAHVYRQAVPPALGSDLADWDKWLASCLTAEELATKPFTPLPVLGVPGWCAGNVSPGFYDDSSVFRPPRETTA